MKTCRKCDQAKPLDAFQRNKNTPDGLQRWCTVCRKEHAADTERKMRKSEYDQQRYAANADAVRQRRHARYHTKTHDRELRQARERRRDGRYKEHDRQRHYLRWADPAYRHQRIASHRERRRRDPEYRRKVYHWRRARQARIKLQGKPFTHAEWVMLCERYDHRCLCCGQRKPLSPDHVVPVSRGGPSDIENIQPLCVDCNKRKNARTVDYRPGWEVSTSHPAS